MYLPFILTLILSINLHANNDIHTIGYRTLGGFFSNFILILNHLHFCDQTHKTPLVYWNINSFYYDANGWHGVRDNVWEYYFYQVSNSSYELGYKMHTQYESPDKFNFLPGPFNHPHISQEKREMGRKLIDKYIRIKPHIHEKIESFIEENFIGYQTIGIHYRGTDKFTTGESRIIGMQEILDIAYAKAQEFSNSQFFIATDQEEFIMFAQNYFKGKNRLIFYNTFRSPNEKSIHHPHSHSARPSMAQIGEDTLIDMVLLAHCNFLIRTPSNLSVVSLIWNPQLPDQLIS